MKNYNNKKIYVAGHSGMLGSAIKRLLEEKKNINILIKKREELDLCDQNKVRIFFEKEKPDEVYLVAAKVGGIFANNHYPADFIYDNLMIQSNVIHQAFLSGVKKLLFIGTSCSYPALSCQPIKEKELLNGKLEPTNEPYALAKIAGIKMCESYNRQYGETHGIDYRSIISANLYGPGDNFHPQNGHVIPALIRKFHDAKVNNLAEVIVWGSGKPRREFLYVDDLADAAIFVMQMEKSLYKTKTDSRQYFINFGSGEDITIKNLVKLIAKVVNYKGLIIFDSTKSDGVKLKLLDSSIARSLGWKPRMLISDGLSITYKSFINEHLN
jgi:GDP-L-fucose synthase